ncbi:hypothetical protein [Salinisphaera aquimarina]|uniref:Uncharacterized protein n=1 Tax=Salinisphaera aquimarina TaxID=2094031 RepID=A0ABV7EX93_9GAMM
MLGLDLVEGGHVLGPAQAGLGLEHIGDTRFGEDEGVFADCLLQYAEERSLGGGQELPGQPVGVGLVLIIRQLLLAPGFRHDARQNQNWDQNNENGSQYGDRHEKHRGHYRPNGDGACFGQRSAQPS